MPDSQGVVLTNGANLVEGKHIHNYSTFSDSLCYRKYFTLRFGDYTPSFEMEGVPTDHISLNSRDMIDSLSLKAPFKGSIRKIKESFMVPNMAILPLNWDRIYAQPSNGDDVPVDANCVLRNFPERFSIVFNSFLSALRSNLPSSSSTHSDICSWLTALLRSLVIGEYIYSSGSLLNVCGYKANSQFFAQIGTDDDNTYDHFFDRLISYVFGQYPGLLDVTEPVGGSTRLHHFAGITPSTGDLNGFHHRESFRSMLELFRENPLCYFTDYTLTGSSTDSTYGAFLGKLVTDYPNSDHPLLLAPNFILPISADSDDLTDMSQNNLNLSRLLAYQLICAHYYSNSSVDFIYSAELYRQYVHYFLKSIYNSGITPDYVNLMSFTANGLSWNYDFLSGHVLEHQLLVNRNGNVWNLPYSNLIATDPNVGSGWWIFASYAAIFSFRKSLRYGDYFVGARPRPLAPINTDVSVNNNMVSVIDVTRSIQAQRFANAVMRSRSKIEEYVKSLFGGSAPAPDYHNPFFLSRETEVIFGDEVQNTGAAQLGSSAQANSRTSNFASSSGRFTFTFRNDDKHPCIYLQIISFDIKRAYTRSVDRQFLHLDRYDMFNPDFQYIGDQAIYGIELGYPSRSANYLPAVFGYQTRDEEYKQRFDVACGGFVNNLPGWCFTDVDTSRLSDAVIDPNFIRSYNTELDQFFLSLTGYSLGSYFHFICITDNNVDAKRPMAVDPQILA